MNPEDVFIIPLVTVSSSLMGACIFYLLTRVNWPLVLRLGKHEEEEIVIPVKKKKKVTKKKTVKGKD